jgi:catechol 2,3-dioxygenase-like lactoylglutathione lyase family enzyme
MTVNVRYIVDDVEKAIEFYTGALGFTVAMHPAPGFAALDRGELRLYMNAPGAGGAGATVADQTPQPGGWNRIQLEVDDLAALHSKLSSQGRTFRGEIIHGQGGDQALIEDPAGNLVELFQSKR